MAKGILVLQSSMRVRLTIINAELFPELQRVAIRRADSRNFIGTFGNPAIKSDEGTGDKPIYVLRTIHKFVDELLASLLDDEIEDNSGNGELTIKGEFEIV